MVSSVSGRYLGKRLLDCFHIAHTHALGGVAFWGAMTSELFLNSDFEAIIDFNWWQMISSVSG